MDVTVICQVKGGADSIHGYVCAVERPKLAYNKDEINQTEANLTPPRPAALSCLWLTFSSLLEVLHEIPCLLRCAVLVMVAALVAEVLVRVSPAAAFTVLLVFVQELEFR